MNLRVLLGRLAPITVAVGRTVCLFMDFLGSQAQIGLASSDRDPPTVNENYSDPALHEAQFEKI